MAALIVGESATLRGYVLVASHIRGRDQTLLEDVLGYRPGRLARGWYLLFLLDAISANDFEMHGYTHFSGGRAAGASLTAEEDLRARGVEVDRIKRRQAAERFKTHGPDRIAKVIPVIDHSDVETYPPGRGIPQWRLVQPKQFKIKAFIGPGEVYLGDYAD